MIVDLHTHSRRSDGTDSPTELVERAAARGIDVVGLTDHDSTTGWDEAAKAAERVGIRLVRGLEISCRYGYSGVHLLAYGVDRDHGALVVELERVLGGRNARLPATISRLRALGIDLTEEDVHELAGDAAATGRPHVADVLVARGVVASRDEAFDRFLATGRPAYVDRYAADLHHMIGLVRDAGGVSVIAHPWGRGGHRLLDGDAFEELREIGLSGLEVDHNDHGPAARTELRAIARELDLIVTGSSDYHGTGKVGFELACNTTEPEEYARLEAAISSAESR